MEDETCRKGIVSGGVGFLELFREEEEFYGDIFCTVTLTSFSLNFDSNPLQMFALVGLIIWSPG